MGDFNASFPSGHAGSAFAVASVFAETYGEQNPWVPWVVYPIAAGTSLSRIDDDRHWLSDVFLGGAIGYFTGKMVARYSPFLKQHNVSLRPFNEDGAVGVAVSLRH